jgi:PleD family two-component response regulator
MRRFSAAALIRIGGENHCHDASRRLFNPRYSKAVTSSALAEPSALLVHGSGETQRGEHCGINKKMRPSQRILVIDDNRDAADTLTMLLELYGSTVNAAYGGAAGIEALRAFKPQFVFLDLDIRT